GRLGRLDLLLVLFAAHAALPPSAAGAGVAEAGSVAGAEAKSLASTGGGNSGIGTSTAGATGAVASATGSVGGVASGVLVAGVANAAGSDGGVAGVDVALAVSVAIGATGSWIIFSMSVLKPPGSSAEVKLDVVSSNCFFRSAISASRIASWNWP